MNCADTLVLIDVNRRLSEVSMVSPKIEPLNYQLSNRGVRASLWFYSAVTLLLSDLFNQPDSGKVAYCSVAATLWPVDGGPGGGGGGWQGWVGGVGGAGEAAVYRHHHSVLHSDVQQGQPYSASSSCDCGGGGGGGGCEGITHHSHQL